MVTLQRLSNLKKVKNILPLLNLSISQKMILELDKIISMSNIDVTEVQCLEQKVKNKDLPIIKDFAPSILVDRGSTSSQKEDSVLHIANVQLQTLQPESISTQFQSDTLSYVTKTKIINPKKIRILSDWGSSTQDNFSSFDMSNTFTSIDNPVLEEIHSDISDQGSNENLSESDDQIQEIESVRITPGSAKATTTRTFIRLPSGKALSIQNARAQDTITDKKNAPTIQFSRPKSLIKDLISSKK